MPSTCLPGFVGHGNGAGVLDGLEVEDVGPDYFRRTAASLMAGAGVSRLVIAKVLNHAEKGITAVYDRHSLPMRKSVSRSRLGRGHSRRSRRKRKAPLSCRFGGARDGCGV